MLRYGLHDSVSSSMSVGVRIAPLTLFFPFNRLLRDSMVRPTGSGGGGGASGARESALVTEGVSGGGIEVRPNAPGVAVLAATAGREDDTSSEGGIGTRPFKVGSSSAAGSPSWSESIRAEVGVFLTGFLDFAGVDLSLALPSAAFRGSAAGSGSFFGDTSMRYSGWCSDNTQRRRPRCTPRSPARYIGAS